jgi:hypothetical protein
VQYLQKAAKALYEAAKEVFERVKVTAQCLVELFIEAVTRVLAWVDEHKAYLFLMVVAAFVLYKTLVKNAETYGEWAGWYGWARGLVKEHEFTVKAEEVKRLRETQKRLEEAAEEVRKELNTVLTLYSQKRDIYEKLKPLVEVDVKKAEELAEASYKRLSDYSDVNMGTKVYAALLSIARGGIYGHIAMLLVGEGAPADVVSSAPMGAYNKAWDIAKGHGEAVD